MRNKKIGFTLLEVLVVVIIIAVLAAIAVPMYKHAILKSRFSTVMPMAKAVADAQEIYYLGNNQYALGKEDLDIAPVEAENTQVSLSPAEEDEEYIYVAAHRTDIPNVRYIMYQKNSPKFAGNIHCEADANDEDALWLCEKALHGTEVTGSLQGKQYKTFLLAGDLEGSSFKVCPDNAVCNDEGNVTGCESGYYQEEQTCKEEKACDESKKTIRTACAEDCGEEIKEGTCNTKTGQWENYTVTQACPVKPAVTEDCGGNASGTITYDVSCNSTGTGWQRSLVSKACTYGEYEECRPSSSNSEECSGHTFTDQSECIVHTNNVCEDNVYKGESACHTWESNSCNGGIYNDDSSCNSYSNKSDNCNNAIFEDNSMCISDGINSCNNAQFNGTALCSGHRDNNCNNSTFNEWSYCWGYNANACNGNTYKEHSSCVAWVTGSCQGTYENGSYCSPGRTGGLCPAGTPASSTSGECWDGNGNKGSQYCNE